MAASPTVSPSFALFSVELSVPRGLAENLERDYTNLSWQTQNINVPTKMDQLVKKIHQPNE